MRLVTYESGGKRGVGVRVGASIVATSYADMLALVQDGPSALKRLQGDIKDAKEVATPTLKAPLTNPGKMLFCGMNYKNHIEENPAAVMPTEPSIFSKFPSVIIAPGDAISIPKPETQTDYEVELALIVGKVAHRVSAAKARDYIFGYTIINDVSARDVQFKNNQITMGKNPDTFCPMGPEIVTPDEIGDPQALSLSSTVNGEVRQSSSTSEMIFDINTLIEFVTSTVTLYPGDVVSTGTPAGVGAFRKPPTWLQPGDEVTLAIDKLGELTNPVVAGW